MTPGNHESAGNCYSGKTRKDNRVLRTALVQAAHAAAHTKDTYLSALYHRLAGRRGKKKAIMAVAHSILVTSYYMLLRDEPYQDAGANYFDQRQPEQTAKRLLKRLQKLGYQVELKPQSTPQAA